MTTIEKINFWQSVFTALAVAVAGLAAWLAYSIGKRQNQINEMALNIAQFTEVFLMPQQVLARSGEAYHELIRWNILIKNVSSHPIYLNSFTLNDTEQDIGMNAIPNNENSWYAIPIAEDIQREGRFAITVKFENYQGKKFKAEGSGIFDGFWWQIKSSKREEI